MLTSGQRRYRVMQEATGLYYSPLSRFVLPTAYPMFHYNETNLIRLPLPDERLDWYRALVGQLLLSSGVEIYFFLKGAGSVRTYVTSLEKEVPQVVVVTKAFALENPLSKGCLTTSRWMVAVQMAVHVHACKLVVSRNYIHHNGPAI